MRTDWLFKGELEHVLAALMPPNRLALEVSMATGLRIGDVLSLRVERLLKADNRRVTIKEQKTGKSRRLTLPDELYHRMLQQAGRCYVFEHRHDWRKHRTRQAVWKDVKRAGRLFRVKVNVAPHTARKTWAVEEFHRTRDLDRVRKKLNHTSADVTAIYIMADELTARKRGKRSGS